MFITIPASEQVGAGGRYGKGMKTKRKALFFLVLSFMPICISFGGPRVSPQNGENIIVRDNQFKIKREITHPKEIKLVQDIFLRAKKIGDTKSHLTSPTHKIDFTDRWLIDLKQGEFAVKRVSPEWH